MLKLRTPAYYDLHGISPKAKIYFLEPTERTVIHVDSEDQYGDLPRTNLDLHEISPKAKIYFLEPNEIERTVIHVDSEDEYGDLTRPNLEKNDCVKNLDVQLSPKLSRTRRNAVRYYPRKFIDDSSNGDSNSRRLIRRLVKPIEDSSNGGPRKPIADSPNGDSYSRKAIAGSSNCENYTRKPIKYSSNGKSYPRMPVKDSSNAVSFLRRLVKDSSKGDSYHRKPIKDFLNGASYSEKTNEGTSNYENHTRKVNFKNFLNDESYSKSTTSESSKYENCCNRTIRGSSKDQQPLVFRKRLNAVRIMRYLPNSDYNDSNRNLDDTIMNLSMSNVPNATRALEYNSDDTLVGHSFSLFDSSNPIDKSFNLTSTPKGKRKSVKSAILMDTTAKSYSFCKETLSKADLRLESIKSCLRPNLGCKIVHSTHEVLSTDLLNSPYSFCKETLSKANLRLESIQSCVKTKTALDQSTSKISCYLNTALQLQNYKRKRFERLSTKWTPGRRHAIYYPSMKIYLNFLDFERRQLEAA